MSVIGNLEIFNSTFHWQIKNFSSIDVATGVQVFSPIFNTAHPHTKKLQWQLIFYPAGCDEKSKKFMGLRLRYMGEGQVSVSYALSILDDKNNNVIVYIPITESSFKKNESQGSEAFCLKALVHDGTKHALINDTLLISCNICVKSTTLDDEHHDEDDNARAHFENLLESGDFSDITFEIGREKLRLHKAIVTSVSPVFFAMFQHQMKEKEESVAQIADVKYEVMKELFRYVYARKVNDIESIAGDLLAAADKYDVQGLRILCENILLQNLNVDNALQYLELAVKHNTTLLKSKGIEFVVSRLDKLVDKPEFEEMDGICKGELLRAIARRNKQNK